MQKLIKPLSWRQNIVIGNSYSHFKTGGDHFFLYVYLDYIVEITQNIPLYCSNMTWFLPELLKGELSIWLFFKIKFWRNMFQMYFTLSTLTKHCDLKKTHHQSVLNLIGMGNVMWMQSVTHAMLQLWLLALRKLRSSAKLFFKIRDSGFWAIRTRLGYPFLSFFLPISVWY